MISSHLSPEPERRIWILLENMRSYQADAERKLAAVAAVALFELAFLNASALRNPPLALAFLLGFVGYATPLPRRLDVQADKTTDDSLVTPEGLAKYTHGDLIVRLDKFLGGELALGVRLVGAHVLQEDPDPALRLRAEVRGDHRQTLAN